MKKLLVLLLIASMLFSLVSCDGDKEEESASGNAVAETVKGDASGNASATGNASASGNAE